jgi:hypothetical protein
MRIHKSPGTSITSLPMKLQHHSWQRQVVLVLVSETLQIPQCMLSYVLLLVTIKYRTEVTALLTYLQTVH